MCVCVCVGGIGTRTVCNDSEKMRENSLLRLYEHRSSLRQHNHEHLTTRTLRKRVRKKQLSLARMSESTMMPHETVRTVSRTAVSSRRPSEVTPSLCTNLITTQCSASIDVPAKHIRAGARPCTRYEGMTWRSLTRHNSHISIYVLSILSGGFPSCFT